MRVTYLKQRKKKTISIMLFKYEIHYYNNAWLQYVKTLDEMYIYILKLQKNPTKKHGFTCTDRLTLFYVNKVYTTFS